MKGLIFDKIKQSGQVMRICLLAVIFVMTFTGNNIVMVRAEESSSKSSEHASHDYRDHAIEELRVYYENMKLMYDLSDDAIKKMNKLYSTANHYIDNNSMTVSGVDAYVSQVKSYLDKVATNDVDKSSTKDFLMLSNEVPVTSAKYGEATFMVISLINMGTVDIRDIVLQPVVSNDVTKWPFEIQQAYDAQTIQMAPASDSVDEAYANRMDLGWNFQVRDDVKTGYYPVTFKAKYYVNAAYEEADIVAYINITGRPENGKLTDTEEEKISKPRIIVTGFTTNPGEVYAGDTFTLDVTVQNTSKSETVSNVLFNLEATVEGTDSIASYEAFLPTTGSSSVYVDSIAPGASYDITKEMEVKADLAQKPYVMKVKMTYEDSDHTEYTDTASVSVPIRQELKVDTGTADVLPADIMVGEESNIIFDVYNTGKTTLYNVKVTFDSDILDSGITYLGNVQPGATANADSTVSAIAAGDDSGHVNAVITYEDEKGKEFSMTKDITLFVREEMMEDPSDFMDDIPEEPEKSFPVVWVIVGVVVVAAGVVTVIVIKKKKDKKKKEQTDLEDDLL